MWNYALGLKIVKETLVSSDTSFTVRAVIQVMINNDDDNNDDGDDNDDDNDMIVYIHTWPSGSERVRFMSRRKDSRTWLMLQTVTEGK